MNYSHEIMNVLTLRFIYFCAYLYFHFYLNLLTLSQSPSMSLCLIIVSHSLAVILSERKIEDCR